MDNSKLSPRLLPAISMFPRWPKGWWYPLGRYRQQSLQLRRPVVSAEMSITGPDVNASGWIQRAKALPVVNDRQVAQATAARSVVREFKQPLSRFIGLQETDRLER